MTFVGVAILRPSEVSCQHTVLHENLNQNDGMLQSPQLDTIVHQLQTMMLKIDQLQHENKELTKALNGINILGPGTS